ncbi:MAG: hypothetical protein AAF501_22045 [Pseudomonadota bacterium]
MTDQDKSAGPTELVEDDLEATSGGLPYNFDRAFIKSWSTSGDADDRPTEETAVYYNKISL